MGCRYLLPPALRVVETAAERYLSVELESVKGLLTAFGGEGQRPAQWFRLEILELLLDSGQQVRLLGVNRMDAR